MKNKILAAILCGLIITSLAGCASAPPMELESPAESTVSADAASDTETSDGNAAEPSPQTKAQESDTESASPETQQTAEEKDASETPPPQTVQPAAPQPQKPAESKPAEKPTAQPVSEQPPLTKEPEPPAPVQTETPKPAEPEPTPTKEPEPTPPPAPEPKSIYDYEFDVEAIRQELITVGTGMGLTHTGDMTPDAASWSNPVTASQSFQGSGLERSLKDYVRSMPDIITMYGGTTIEYFTIYAEPLGGGSYRFYFLY